MRKQNIFIMNIKSNLRAKLNNTIKIWRQLYLSKKIINRDMIYDFIKKSLKI